MSLTLKQARFVDRYLVQANAAAAYTHAYGRTGRVAESAGSRLLRNVEVAREIAQRREADAKAADVEVERVIREAWIIATADARELVEFRRYACRHCYGEGHRHQRADAEICGDLRAWIGSGREESEFDRKGGGGFDAHRGPAADCPECFGDGIGRVVVHDTRALSPRARALFAGVRETSYGVQILMHDRGAALDLLARHLGLYGPKAGQRTDSIGEDLRTFVASFHTSE